MYEKGREQVQISVAEGCNGVIIDIDARIWCC